ncbi:hypothetical protein [Halocynthiibacter styelae]|uniref:Uncharacterized protein n=1 Tax=Halocynthiibacter styelae TaxID=2761955 RepID=A0A8J7LPI1_9RHOB|nr:hypothetical protein [Paenihalocynthiibacter styelae]MBI1492857.1 hypothetical protein [Paenihalocynthiibacter styelae]
MSVVFEHDSAAKARRSIIVTSTLIIALYYVRLKSNELDLFGLKVLVEKDNILIFLKLALGYLVYMYAIYEFSEYLSDRHQRLTTKLNNELEEMISTTFPQPHEEKRAEIQEAHRKNENARLVRLSLMIKSYRDYFPVMIFALFAMTDIHERFIGHLLIRELPQTETATPSDAIVSYFCHNGRAVLT